MVIKLAILSVIVLMVAAFAEWAFLPARHLPGNRVRHLRIRLHLRLHPGKGFAHRFQLVAALGTAGRAASLRPDPPVASAALPLRSIHASTRCSWAALITGTACAFRWRSTCW